MRETIASYVPRLLLNWSALHPDLTTHTRSSHNGILLFADTSGFTSLTRSLGERGKSGFEVLTDLLNTLFQSLDEVITQNSGDILKFSGDAVWAYFPPDAPIDKIFSQMLHNLALLNGREGICRLYPLSLHGGAAMGEFQLLTLGGVGTRNEFEIAGDMVELAYRGCDLAKGGELALTDTLLQLIAPTASAQRVESFAILRLTPTPLTTHEEAPSQSEQCTTESQSRFVSRYVPGIIQSRIQGNQFSDTLQSEHRKVTVLFIKLSVKHESNPIPPSQYYETIGKAADSIFTIVDNQNGTIARVDPYETGHKILVLFGALSKSSLDSASAVKAAYEIVGAIPANTEARIGLTSGPLFCGEVGSQLRKEYTVMGDAVNLAARLMSRAAEGKILMDESVFADVGSYLISQPLQFKLKGIDNEVTAHQFLWWKTASSDIPQIEKLYGRNTELETITQYCHSLPDTQSKWILLEGETGVGKTSIVSKYAQIVHNRLTIYLSAKGSKLRHPGWLIGELLTRVVATSAFPEAVAANATLKVLEAVEERWRPLIAPLLAESIPDNEWTRGLSPTLRLERMASSIQLLLEPTISKNIIVLDDLHEADSLATSVVRSLLASDIQSNGLFFLLGNCLQWETLPEKILKLKVGPLRSGEVESWLTTLFVDGLRERQLIKLLVDRSEGNPLFVREALNQLDTNRSIGALSDSTKYEVLRSSEEISIPSGLENLRLSQFDALSESSRYLLKVASVFANEFTLHQLLELSGQGRGEQISGILADLTSQGWLMTRNNNHFYLFASDAARKSIYNCMPESYLRELHLKCGEMLLEKNANRDIMQLAFHFSRSSDLNRAFNYSLEAALDAVNLNSLVEAAEHFEKCHAILQSSQPNPLSLDSRVKFYRSFCEFCIGEGDYGKALALARAGRRLARKYLFWSAHHSAALQTAKILWKQSKYRPCGAALKVILAFPHVDADHSLLAEAYSLMGELNRRTGKLQEAVDAGLKASLLAEQCGVKEVASNVLNNLGLANWSVGALDSARDFFNRTLNANTRWSRAFEARVQNNLSMLSQETGDYVEARRLAESAKNTFRDIGDRRNSAYASGNLANILVLLGKFREAISLYNAADKIFLHLGEMHPHYYTVGNLADVDLVLGEFIAAKDKYQQVERFARDIQDDELLAETTVRFADLAYFNSDNANAETLYRDALDKALQVGSLEFQIRATIGLCRYYIGNRNTEQAEALITSLQSLAKANKSQRVFFESEFLNGELLRIRGLQDRAYTAYHACAAFAQTQEQFELLLKSHVRICETQSIHCEQSTAALRNIMAKLDSDNGMPLTIKIFTSPYLRFFSTTLESILEEHLKSTTDRANTTS